MAVSASIKVEGLDKVHRKMEQMASDMAAEHGSPLAATMREAAMLVTRDAKRLAPVDTGRLRASITPEVRTMHRTIQGVVGSNVFYAPFQELGTGGYVGRPAHWPPGAALERWARRRGLSGYAVARAIGGRGGLRPKKYLQRALEQNAEKIRALFERFIGKVVHK